MRYRKLLTVVLLSLCAVHISLGAEKTPVDYVRPQIDTHNSRWFYFASASRPFGMVSLSPDMGVKGSWSSGYLYDTTEIRCFSHVHGWQLAGVPVMPAMGEVLGHQGMEACKSHYSHEGEIVRPGYHKIHLDRYDVDAELTSTSRVGMHRYQYPAGKPAHVLLDVGAYLAHGPILKSAIHKVSAQELRGYSVLAPTNRRKKPVTVYFTAQFNVPFDTFGGWEKRNDKRELMSGDAFEGKEAGGYVTFDDLQGKPLLMKVGISYVSEEQACLNLDEELPHWDFDRVVRESRDEWNGMMGRIAVEGGTEAQRIKFYTDLWHSLLGRHTFSDVNGKYIDNTGKQPVVRQVPLVKGKPVRNTYNSDAFWGSEFNLNILWSLAYPRVMSEFVSTLTDYYVNGGMIPRGPSGGNYSYVMVGDPAIALIAAAYNKGIRDFDVKTAYAGCLKNSEPGGMRDYAGYDDRKADFMEQYIAHGYVPEAVSHKKWHQEGCALTLYFAYQDWCMAQFARGMGDQENEEKYNARSLSYRNVFDRETGWMCPRKTDGSWVRSASPVSKGFNMPGFIESNAAIFTYYVPHNLPDLIGLIGGQEAFVNKLNGQFEKAAPRNFVATHGAHAENWVDYENQPSLHMAHLFSHAGAPWLTQYWVRRVKADAFGDITPYGGYNGDEDQGQIGALGVLMAIGLFDVTGGAGVDPGYEVTSPLFDKVTIQLDRDYYRGKKLVIETVNNTPENIYIQRVTFKGKVWNSFRIPHNELVRGGRLLVELGPTANKAWGK